MSKQTQFDILNPGILVTDQQVQDDLQSQMSNLLEAIKEGNSQQTQAQFVGANPISMNKKCLQNVKEYTEDWLICEKTDGVRYIMLVMNNGLIYLTGRKTEANGQRRLQFFQVRWELPDSMFDSDEHTLKAVFDGELCEDRYVKYDKIKKTIPSVKYLIFDCLYANNNLQTAENYVFRLKHAEGFLKLKDTATLLNFEKDFYKPCEQLLQFKQTVNKQQRILVLVKDFFYYHQATEYLFKNYIKCLPHKNDGLIFTQNSAKYQPGTMKEIIKWKPPHMNSIDFTIKVNQDFDDQFVLEAYLLGPGNNLLFVDFLIVDQQKYQEFINLQQSEGIEGIVTECNLIEISENDQVFLKGLRQNQSSQNYKYSEQFEEMNGKNKHLYNKMQEQLQKLLKKEPQKGWGLDKYRVDKSYPNYYTVGSNILECLQENITEDILIEESKNAAYLLQNRQQQMQQQFSQQQQQQQQQQYQQQNQQQNIQQSEPYKKQKLQ